ncbi:MAG TPA: tRNA pseudouridine(55) synthase TruB [Gemmatimonadales bacterium]|nr:tRNA pseudouridine(55) synthase TruB [Gemmatimonadales bacterium]
MDKPAGPTSHDVVAHLRRTLRLRAVGHTGTLDPFATGLLIVLLGRATRLARFLEPLSKRYRAVARLGVRTDSDDLTGRELTRVEPEEWPEEATVATVMAGMTGRIDQQPPAYSAKHVDGERSHQLARRGETPRLAAVSVDVRRFGLLRYDPPEVQFVAEVSTGTYVRALARDLGEALGVGAHLTSLRREAVGPFEVADAVPLDAVSAESRLLSPAALLAHLPAVELSEAEATDVGHGRQVMREGTEGRARLMVDGALVAVGEARETGWQPIVVLEGK